jgi:quercetin dioxygenase-like cupin family protein
MTAHERVSMGFETASIDDVESVIPEEHGGMWFFRSPLDAEQVGLTLMELEPGSRGKEHDHEAGDHEEIYLVLDGDVDFDIEDETVTLGEGEAVRVDPETTRQIHNRGDKRARLAIAGAP